MLTEKAKKAQLEYIKKWRKAHPEKVKEYQIKYWENVAKKQCDIDDTKDGADNDK